MFVRNRVMAFGSFDVLHPGHIMYLEKAKKLGRRLIVVVARDESIRMFKGAAPFFNEKERLRMLSALRVVDKAVLGNSISSPEERYSIISRFRPDVVVFGYDQRVSVKRVKAWMKQKGMHVKIVRLRASLNEEFYKSSKIRKGLVRRGRVLQ